MNKNISDYIGNTPLVYLKEMSKDIPANIYLKLEYMNPWFSVKDRIAKNIIEEAEKSGKLSPYNYAIFTLVALKTAISRLQQSKSIQLSRGFVRNITSFFYHNV